MLNRNCDYSNEEDNEISMNYGKDRNYTRMSYGNNESWDDDIGFSISGSNYIGPEVIKPEDGYIDFVSEDIEADKVINRKSVDKSVGQSLIHCFHLFRTNKYTGRVILAAIIIITEFKLILKDFHETEDNTVTSIVQ